MKLNLFEIYDVHNSWFNCDYRAILLVERDNDYVIARLNENIDGVFVAHKGDPELTFKKTEIRLCDLKHTIFARKHVNELIEPFNN